MLIDAHSDSRTIFFNQSHFGCVYSCNSIECVCARVCVCVCVRMAVAQTAHYAIRALIHTLSDNSYNLCLCVPLHDGAERQWVALFLVMKSTSTVCIDRKRGLACLRLHVPVCVMLVCDCVQFVSSPRPNRQKRSRTHSAAHGVSRVAVFSLWWRLVRNKNAR